MARTACWRMKDGELVEKVVDGAEVPEDWYDNPRLEPNTPPGYEPVEEQPLSFGSGATAEPEPEPEPEVTVVTDITDEKPSEDQAAE